MYNIQVHLLMSNQNPLKMGVKPSISIIIVSWNVRALLEANLKRLFSLSCPYPIEVFVVDNASHDGSARMVREQFPQVHLITNDWDAGFAGPNNQALRLAKGEVVLLLNPDMLVEEGALQKTYEKLMQDKSVGVLGIRLNRASGEPIENVRRFPDLASQLAVLLKYSRVFPHVMDHYLYRDFNYSVSQEVDQVRGSYFAFRRELLLSVGYLDEAFHIWFEEVDFCRRAQAAGMRVWYEASVSAQDFVGRSMVQMKHFEKQRIFSASMIHYFKKYHPWWQTALLILARPIGLILSFLADVFVFVRAHFFKGRHEAVPYV